MQKKILLNLFDLKPKKDLEGIHHHYKEKAKIWFKAKKKNISEFFYMRNCPLCESNKSREIFNIDHFIYHQCCSCDSIYAKPFPSKKLIEDLYSDGSYQIYQDVLVKKSAKIRSTTEERKYKQVKEFSNKSKLSLLDVGCGTGSFLRLCKKKGFNVTGVDPMGSNSDNLKKKSDIHVYTADFNNVSIKETFDVITFWGVLEHMIDPLEALKKATTMLKVNGIIAFEVPSSECFIGKYIQKFPFSPTRYIEGGRHNIFFSSKAIEKICESLNLEIEFIESNGLDIQTILFEELEQSLNEKVLRIQDVLNDLLLGDHYRVFLRKIR